MKMAFKAWNLLYVIKDAYKMHFAVLVLRVGRTQESGCWISILSLSLRSGNLDDQGTP